MNDTGIWFLVAFLILLLLIAILAGWRILSIVVLALFDGIRSAPASPPLELKDPLFGQITSRPGSDCWSGQRHFQPAHSLIPVTVQADGGGPSDDQRSLFREIENRFPEFEDEIRRRLAALATEWNPGAKPDFKIVSLFLQGGAEARWTIDFALADSGDDLAYCVSFANGQIEDVFSEV